VRPTEVAITKCDVVVEPAKKPPEANANLIVRVTGNVIDKATQGTVLTGVKVMLHKKDGLRLTTIAVELDHEPLIPPKALAQDRFGQPGSPNDHGAGWRAFPSKAGQNRLKLAPAGAVYEGVGAGGVGAGSALVNRAPRWQ